MNDISEDLGISKKTLYNEFPNKDSIVTEITQTYLCDHAVKCEEILRESKDAAEEMLMILAYVHKTISKLNPNMMSDLKKFYPEGWKAMEEHRQGHIEKMIDRNITRGKNEGLYRPDIDNNMFKKLNIVLMDVIGVSDYFPRDQFPLPVLHKEIMTHFLYGISSEKGHKIIQRHINLLEKK